MHLRDAEKVIKAVDKNRSTYDPARETVGSIYRNAQMNGEKSPVLIGDMTNELTKSLVADINEALSSASRGDKPFFLMVHEKKDLQMRSAILRRLIFFPFRPYPEDDTTVFWKDPRTQELRFCWCLPHWAEMDNILCNEDQFDKEFVYQIKAWKREDLKPFGFYHHPKLKWIPNPKWRDKTIKCDLSSTPSSADEPLCQSTSDCNTSSA